jgi:aminoglycoside phosphotransferase (APT) family kinase protein
MPSTEALLHQLVADAGLPPVATAAPLTGHGFDHEIMHAVLTDGREVVLRHRAGTPQVDQRAQFLAAHHVPAPALLAATDDTTLYEFAPGDMLLTLIEDGRMTDDAWHSVGTAFRSLHNVRFPKRLTGAVGNGILDLCFTDPAQTLHERLDQAGPRLDLVAPHLPKLHAMIDQYADQLRETPTALLHRDIYPANVIVGPERTMLIDWDSPQVGDPGIEIAAFEEHLYLLGAEVPPTFYASYGPRPENTGIHRLTGAIGWLGSGWLDDWIADTDPDRRARASRWQSGLRAYLADRLPKL